MSQQEKILAYMIRRHPDKQWFRASDFMQPNLSFDHPCFVGYEATARMSELDKLDVFFETRQAGKFKERRFKIETLSWILEAAPTWREFIVKEVAKTGMDVPERPPKFTYVQQPNGTVLEVPTLF